MCDTNIYFSSPSQATILLEGLRRELKLKPELQFAADPSMSFAPGQVHGLEWQSEKGWHDLRDCNDMRSIQALRLSLSGMGMLGTSGPMPFPLTSFVISRMRTNEHGLADFIAMLENSVLRLQFETIWELSPEYGPAQRPAEQQFADAFYAIAGVLTDGLRGVPTHSPSSGPEQGMLCPVGKRPDSMVLSGKIGGGRVKLGSATPTAPAKHEYLPAQNISTGTVPDALFLACAPIWGQQVRTAAGLEKIIHTAFDIAAKVIPFRGAWVEIPQDCRSRLGVTTTNEWAETAGSTRQNCTLGDNVLLGRHMWDTSAAVTLRLGPLSEEQRRDFLPPPAGRLRGQLLAIVRWYLGDSVGCAVKLHNNEPLI